MKKLTCTNGVVIIILKLKEEIMDVKNLLKEKKNKLNELLKARSKANCSSTYSSQSDVKRETEIEELEEEIRKLEEKI